MKYLPISIALVAIVVASSSFYVSNQKLHEQELKIFALEKKVNELNSQQFLNETNSIANQQLQNPPLSVPLTSISFDKMEHDFGKIKQGKKVKTIFKFTNSGKENLIIQNAYGSCGCTVPSYPKEPLAPGKTAEMVVEFDSNGKEGEQNKTVTVEANTEPRQTVLTIKSTVLK
jgi:uncharacterized cupredoxin-like copper-binding protein